VLTGSTDAARVSDVSELTGFAEGEACEVTRGESRSSASAFGADCKLFAVAFCFRKASNYRNNSLFSYKGSKDTDCSGIAEPAVTLRRPASSNSFLERGRLIAASVGLVSRSPLSCCSNRESLAWPSARLQCHDLATVQSMVPAARKPAFYGAQALTADRQMLCCINSCKSSGIQS